MTRRPRPAGSPAAVGERRLRQAGQLGALLHLSPTTVRNYLSNAITKTGGCNRIDAIRIARNAGWI